MKQRLHRRWMLALAAFTLTVTALFGLFAMVFVYTVEDRFLERLLQKEAQAQRAHLAVHGRYGATGSDFISLHLSAASLPPDLARTLAEEPRRSEVAGSDGRHYHLLALQSAGAAPWLVAEVSQQLIVRPMRADLLRWLVGWGLAMVAVALLLGWWLTRRVTAPLETLALRVAQASPQRLPAGVQAMAEGLGDNEIGAVAKAFDALLGRTRAFIEREQAFTRDASHELRTPLAVMRLTIERLQAAPATDAGAQAQLAALHAAALLMEQTVATLLLLAREDEAATGTTAPAPEPVALLPLVEQWVLAHAAWLDRQSLTLDIQLQRHDSLRLPAPVLQLAIASLVGNAFAHGTAGGRVALLMDGGVLRIRNPGAPLPPQAGADFGKGEHSSGHGLGLGILQRLLAARGGRLQLSHAQGITTAALHD
jgi:signal transduction histidine kinase